MHRYVAVRTFLAMAFGFVCDGVFVVVLAAAVDDALAIVLGRGTRRYKFGVRGPEPRGSANHRPQKKNQHTHGPAEH